MYGSKVIIDTIQFGHAMHIELSSFNIKGTLWPQATAVLVEAKAISESQEEEEDRWHGNKSCWLLAADDGVWKC